MSIIYTCVYTHTHKHKYNLLNLYVVYVCFHGWWLLLIIIIMIFTNKYTLTHIIYMPFFLSVHLLMTTISIIILCVNKKSNRKIHVCLYTLEAQTSMIHMNTKLALSPIFSIYSFKEMWFSYPEMVHSLNWQLEPRPSDALPRQHRKKEGKLNDFLYF